MNISNYFTIVFGMNLQSAHRVPHLSELASVQWFSTFPLLNQLHTEVTLPISANLLQLLFAVVATIFKTSYVKDKYAESKFI